MKRTRACLIAAGVLGLLGVGTGAYGAHGLEKVVSEARLIAVWNTGARYALSHALALLALAALSERFPKARSLSVAALGFVLGTLVFSGSLWLLALSGIRWLGAITPLGGLGLLVGWAALIVTGLRAEAPSAP